MEKIDTESMRPTGGDPGVRPAKLPSEAKKDPSSLRDHGKNGSSTDRAERNAVSSNNRCRKNHSGTPESQLQRCERTILDHQQKEIDVSRAARKIIDGSLYKEKGFESLNNYTKNVIGVGANQFRKYSYHAKVFDVVEENRKEIAEQSLTNVRDLPLPVTRAWARPLHKKVNSGCKAQIIEIWAAVVRQYGSSITEERVKKVRDEIEAKKKDSEKDSDQEKTTEDGRDSGKNTNSGNDSPDENEPPPENEPGENEIGKPKGFSVDFPPDVETAGPKDRPPAEGSVQSFSGRNHSDVETLIDLVEQNEKGLSRSSAEHMIASKIWQVLIPSSFEEMGSGLPETSPSGVVLKPSRLDQVIDLPPGLDEERMLVCPGVDLFAEIIPSDVIDFILARCRRSKHKPVLFTRHLGRAANFDLSGLWVGAPTSRSSLKDTEQALIDAAPTAAVRWVLYDVGKEDKKEPPSFSEKIDWVVYDPEDRNAGIALTLSEVAALTEAAEEIEARWTFRKPFTTCGDSFPKPSSSLQSTSPF